jgi:hypothetical protein
MPSFDSGAGHDESGDAAAMLEEDDGHGESDDADAEAEAAEIDDAEASKE